MMLSPDALLAMRPFRVLCLFVSLLIFIVGVSPTAAQPSTVVGTVQAPNGDGVPYANVQIEGTTDGSATDSTGHFRFRTAQTGSIVLRVSAVGYDPVERSLALRPGDTVSVHLVLSPHRVQLEETIVTDDAYSTGSGSQATLSPTEAVTTPGAAGDLLRALQSFPGVASPGEGAGLYVRGGDVSETKTLLDQAPVHHPYRYESPAGGSFGALPPSLIDGTHLSTGAFSAQYGNALSGILAMESKDRPTAPRRSLELGLAGASVSLDQPLLEDRLGVRISGNRSFTGLLFRVNGQRGDYETVPQGFDGALSLTWDERGTGQIKFTSFGQMTRLGVETTAGTHRGMYRSRSTNQLHSLQWTTVFEAWTTELSASWNAFSSTRTFGSLDLSPTDAAATARFDATRSAEQWTLRTGGVLERRSYRFEGALPLHPTVNGPDAPTRRIEESTTSLRSGAYTEVESSLFSPIGARVGLRVDHERRTGHAVVDPRVELSWNVSSRTRLRVASGFYHQFPSLATSLENTGNAPLELQEATHVVAGLHHERGNLTLRTEAYHKSYRNLVVRTGSARYANAGTGRAQGLDVFAKYGAFLETRVNGWASYSLLDSRRTQPRECGSTVQLDHGPAPYDLTHQATVVGKVRVIDQFRLGGTYRYTTGRPFTPVVDSRQTNEGTVLPIEGPVGSERFPAYHRLDLQFSYYWPFNRQQYLIVYAAVNNVLDRKNVVGVTYSSTYEERRQRTTNVPRSAYVGLTLTL